MEQRRAIDMAIKIYSERDLSDKTISDTAVKHTAIDIRQMEHSEEWVDELSASLLATFLPRLRSLLCVVTLSRG